jgi:IS605 OrfB family transposase
VTQLHEKNNQDIIDYFESARGTYAQAQRKTFYAIRNSPDFNKSSYNTYLQETYGVLKRTANSIIADAQGQLNALKELKAYERKQLTLKIKTLESNIHVLEVEKSALKKGLPACLGEYRNLKRKLVAQKSKLNKLKQKSANLSYQIESGRYKICFGSKRLLQTDYQAFVDRRDAHISFIGSKSETSGNQILQLRFNSRNNQLELRLRKDIGGFKNAKDKYVYGRVYFNHHKKWIKEALRQRNTPLSFKIIKKRGRFYLYCTFEIQMDKSDFQTRSTHGTVGLDFNKSFVTLAETNQYGHLVNTQLLPYRFKAGSKTATDLEAIATEVVERGLMTGKDICVENLNFKTAKASTLRKQGRKYNEMLHSLAYRQFVDKIEQRAYRHAVSVRRVNPAWTSWLAKQLYCPTMKLNTHVGAAYVIARRGQGHKDSVK